MTSRIDVFSPMPSGCRGEDEKVDSRLGANILGGVKWPQSIATQRDRAGDAILWRALICDTVRRSFEGGLSPG